MTARRILPNRRGSHVLEFTFKGARYRAGYSFFPNGALAEIFLTTGKPNSEADVCANDSAILASIGLQHGVPLQTIRHALLRAPDGSAAGALSHALTLIDAGGYA